MKRKETEKKNTENFGRENPSFDLSYINHLHKFCRIVFF